MRGGRTYSAEKIKARYGAVTWPMSWERDPKGIAPSASRVARFACEKGVALDLEKPRLAFPACATKGVNRRPDPFIDETALLKHMPPACPRQATGNSVGPKVDVADRRFRHGLARRDVGKLQTPTWPKHSHDFGEDPALVGAKVDDAVADHDVCLRNSKPPTNFA